MSTDKQTKAIVSDLLKNPNLNFSDIFKILVDLKLTISESKRVVKMLNFFNHKYMDNTIGWFKYPKSIPLEPGVIVDDIRRLVYEPYIFLGLTFEDIKNSKGYVPDNNSRHHEWIMDYSRGIIEDECWEEHDILAVALLDHRLRLENRNSKK